MKKMLRICISVIFVIFSQISPASAVTVDDSHGKFTLDYQPKRVVALEFSFVDALVSVGVNPIGIADDNDSNGLLPSIKEKLGNNWTSVGLRSQPSLEVIASLKPDLIIADVDRHSGIYDDLNKIAPTLLLPSRRETYEDNLKSAAIIGKVVGKGDEITQRLIQHDQIMQSYKERLKAAHLDNKVVQFGVPRENGFYAHSQDSYTGGVIRALGLNSSPLLKNESGSRQIGFEQLLAINPDYLVLGDYVSTNHSIVEQWAKLPLWNMLKVVQNHHIYHVDGSVWVKYRGLLAAERMAKDLMQLADAQ